MPKLKVLIAVAILLAALLGVFLDPTRTILGRLSGEEFHAGRPASYWFQELAADPARNAQALDALKHVEAIPVIRTLLKPVDQPQASAVRLLALDLLTELGPDAHAAGEDVLALLKDTDPLVPPVAAGAIPKLGVPAAEAIPALVAALDGPAAVAASRAISTYKGAAQETIPIFEKILLDASRTVEVRWNAARTLGKIGPAAVTSVPALVSLLHDPEITIREHAAEAIGDIGPSAAFAIPDLLPLLDDENDRVRRDTVRSLGYMGASAKEYGPQIVRMLDDKAEIVRDAAKNALLAVAPELMPQPAPTPEKPPAGTAETPPSEASPPAVEPDPATSSPSAPGSNP